MPGARTETSLGLARAEAQRTDWDRAYREHAPVLLRYLRRLTDRDSAEDLLQDTFERATRAGRSPAGSELRPWLYRIATNLVVDRARRRRLLSFVPFSGREAGGGSAFDSTADAVKRALAAIPSEQAAVLVLRLHEGFSRAEIAGLLQVSERTVKDRLERGRQSFAAAYQREESAR